MGDGTGRRGEAFLEMPPRPGPKTRGRFSFADPDRVRRVLVGSGWQGIELTPLDFQIPLGRTMEDALAFVLEMGPLSAPLGEVTGENRTRAIDAINRVLEDNTCEDGIVRLAGPAGSLRRRRSETQRFQHHLTNEPGQGIPRLGKRNVTVFGLVHDIRSIATSRARSASRAVSAWLRLPR